MKSEHLRCSILLIYFVFYTCPFSQGSQKTHRRTPESPSKAQNLQLLKSLDDYIEQTHKALLTHQNDLLLSLNLGAWDFNAGQDQLENLTRSLGYQTRTVNMQNISNRLDMLYGMYKTGRATALGEYLEVLSELTVTVAGLFEGPISWNANGVDLLRQIGETWALAYYQGDLLKQRWDLGQAILYAQARDPRTQALFSRVISQMNSNAQSQRIAFQGALAHTGITEQILMDRVFKNTTLPNALGDTWPLPRDPFLPTAVIKGLTIVDPESAINSLSADPEINPDFLLALKRCQQVDARAFTYRGWYEDAMACDKYADGSYIPAFRPFGLLGTPDFAPLSSRYNQSSPPSPLEFQPPPQVGFPAQMSTSGTSDVNSSTVQLSSPQDCLSQEQACVDRCISRVGLDAFTPTTLCEHKCEVAYAYCQGKEPSPDLIRYIAHDEAVTVCRRNFYACSNRCNAAYQQSISVGAHCMDGCNKASENCNASVPPL